MKIVVALAACGVSAFLEPHAARHAPLARLSASHAPVAEGDQSQLFVRKIAYDADETAVREAMEQFGPVARVHLPANDGPDEAAIHRGYGFVTFRSPEAAAAALALDEGPLVHGRPLMCMPAKPRAPKVGAHGERFLERGLLFTDLKRLRRRDDVAHCLDALAPLETVKEFTVAISAYARARDPTRALALWDEMHTRELEPDVICFNAAISASGWERAIELLTAMTRRVPNQIIPVASAAAHRTAAFDLDARREVVAEQRAAAQVRAAALSAQLSPCHLPLPCACQARVAAAIASSAAAACGRLLAAKPSPGQAPSALLWQQLLLLEPLCLDAPLAIHASGVPLQHPPLI